MDFWFFCDNTVYALSNCFSNCGWCTTTGTPNIGYGYAALIKMEIYKKLNIQHVFANRYVTGNIMWFIFAVGQLSRFYIFYLNKFFIGTLNRQISVKVVPAKKSDNPCRKYCNNVSLKTKILPSVFVLLGFWSTCLEHQVPRIRWLTCLLCLTQAWLERHSGSDTCCQTHCSALASYGGFV